MLLVWKQLILIFCGISTANPRLIIKELNYNANAEFANVTVDLLFANNSQSIYSNITLLRDLKKVMAKFEVGFSDGGGKVKKDTNMLDFTINLCRVTDVSGNFFVKNVLEKLKSVTNATLRCPMKKGLIQIYGFRADGKAFPSFLVQNKQLITIIKVIARVVGTQHTVDLLNVKALSEFKD